MNLSGLDAYDPEGHKIGRIGTVFVDQGTGEPEWATVHTGMFGRRESYLPLAGALKVDHGVQVGVRKDAVKDAPRANGPLTDVAPLCAHYGLPVGDLPVPVARTPRPSDMPRRRYVVAPDHTVTERPSG